MFIHIDRKKITKTLAVILVALVILGAYDNKIIGKILYPYPYKQIIEKYAHSYGVDPLLVVSVMREESHFLTHSSSHKGAIGLMQLMPETAKDISAWLDEDYNLIDLKNPEDNIRYGTWYLSSLDKQFSGNSILVLAAYNAGSGRVSNWLRTSPRDLNTYLIEDIPFQETRDYVTKVLKSYRKYSGLYQR